MEGRGAIRQSETPHGSYNGNFTLLHSFSNRVTIYLRIELYWMYSTSPAFALSYFAEYEGVLLFRDS